MTLELRYRAFCQFCLFALLCLATLILYIPPIWRVPVFEWSAYTLALLTLGPALLLRRLRFTGALLPFALCVVWSALQVVFHWTVYPYLTELSVLQGLALFCLFWSAQHLLSTLDPRTLERYLLLAFWFAVAIVLMHLVAHRLSPQQAQRYFPLLPDQIEKYGIFSTYNGLAQFSELFIAVGLWRAIRRPFDAWLYWGTAVALALAVIYAGSRAGSAIVVLELMAGALLGLPRHSRRRLLPVLLLGGLICAGGLTYWLTARRDWIAGHGGDPLGNRGRMTMAALEMLRDHPLAGVGLGNFSTVHPAYATFDLGQFVNFTHNDTAQALSEGGLVFAALLLWLVIPYLRRLPESPWALGLIAVYVHSCSDYPFHTISIVAWAVTLLASVVCARTDRL